MYTDGITTYINAAICDISYKAKQPAYVFDLPVRSSNNKVECASSETESKVDCGSSSSVMEGPSAPSSSQS